MKLLSTPEVAALTHKTLMTVSRWIHGQNKKGLKLPTTRQGNYHRIDRKDLKEFLIKLYGVDQVK